MAILASAVSGCGRGGEGVVAASMMAGVMASNRGGREGEQVRRETAGGGCAVQGRWTAGGRRSS
jgi:hypothetical protein